MAQMDVVDLGGKKVGSFELADDLFGPEQVNEPLLWEAVKHYRAAQRQGTAATKNRKLVSGAGKKLWKQKGTGRARVGSIRSPLWRHAGTVHGPQPRSYAYAFPHKKLMGALRAAMASKVAEGKLTIVESLEIKEAKTKLYRIALNKLEVTKTVLLVDSGKTASEGLARGARNLKGVDVMLNSEVHPYDLLKAERAIFSRPALEQLAEALKKTVSRRKAAENASADEVETKSEDQQENKSKAKPKAKPAKTGAKTAAKTAAKKSRKKSEKEVA